MDTKDYLDFDGQSYIEQMIATNPNPLLSPYGFIYSNQNQPEEMHNGRNFPDYVYKDSPITLELSSNDESEYLYRAAGFYD